MCSVYLTRFKEFKSLCPCSFTSTPVKGADNFWIVQGIIGGFGKLFMKTSLGVENTADESMSTVQFHTINKDYLPHYFFILRKTYP